MKRTGGSNNPIVFNDYESFVAKFTDKAKTTDDCYTPQDVYEAVVEYVKSIHDMTGKLILRPFFPGGDYENAEYPENGVVIDNPPFSIFTKICRWYSEKNIPFFLFGPGLTIGQIFDCYSRSGLFGNHLLVRSDVGERVKTAVAAAAAIPIELSEREREIVRRL